MNFSCSYIICSTPRSGSTLLCDLLKSTQVAGRPDSFFMDKFYVDWATHLNLSTTDWKNECEFSQSYLDAVLLEGTGETKAFGLRLQYESLEGLSNRLKNFYPDKQSDRERFSTAFSSTHYIHLSREDKVSQAVSLLRAEQSGLWHIHADGTERERLKQGKIPVYDYNALSTYHSDLNENDTGWKNWFAQQNIKPIPIKYEMLSAHPAAITGGLLSSLGLDPKHAETIKPKTKIISDNESREWEERFRNEKINKHW